MNAARLSVAFPLPNDVRTASITRASRRTILLSATARLLAPSTVDEMVTNQIPGVPGVLAVIERHDEGSWGYGWGVASHERWNGYPTHPPGTFSHAGATGTYMWCDPAHELVGVSFAPMAAVGGDGMPRWQADLLANAVTAAIDT